VVKVYSRYDFFPGYNIILHTHNIIYIYIWYTRIKQSFISVRFSTLDHSTPAPHHNSLCAAILIDHTIYKWVCGCVGERERARNGLWFITASSSYIFCSPGTGRRTGEGPPRHCALSFYSIGSTNIIYTNLPPTHAPGLEISGNVVE